MGNDNLGDDYVGDDYVGDDDMLGAVAPRGRALQVRKPQLQGSSRPPVKLRGYLGIGTVTFDSTTQTVQSLIVEPQRAFRPERLIIARRDSGAAAISSFVKGIFIGDMPQSPSVAQPAPTEMFSADATVSGIDFNKCVP